MKKIILAAFAALALTGCNDYLDVAPQSQITPESYMNDESHLQAYMMGRYTTAFSPDNGYAFTGDNGTDNQVTKDYNNSYTLSEYKVGTGSSWWFGEIYNLNWFFEKVLPAWEAGKISGNADNVKHWIGEAYLFRAWQYFSNVRTFGDFPIITSTYDVDKDQLISVSARRPRTEVVEFILSDLDKAIEYMKEGVQNNKTTMNRDVAYLIKSRVALYEASWMKYFKGTPFVPTGEGWPGAKMYPDFQFSKGSYDAEMNWLYEQAIEAAEHVADHVALTPNSHILPQNESENNDYLMMFGALDMSKYNEILLWKQYNFGLGVANGTAQYAAGGNADKGITRGMVDAFVMKDGLPRYASSENYPYKGDNSIADVVRNRDERMFLFVKQPGQINGYINKGTGNQGHEVEPNPEFTSSTYGFSYPTGYACRKGWNPDVKQWYNLQSSCGVPLFRATEAYLNYIEAYYERYGNLNDKADQYWRAIRKRAGVDEDYQKTINATNMEEEAKEDWGAWSAGKVLTDKTLYNIRRERRCELMLEGFRWQDIFRWRSLDQMCQTPYHIEGFKIWNSDMTDWYKDLDYTSATAPNVTPPSEGDYVRVWEIKKTHNPIVEQGGLMWKMGHYLSPIGIDEFRKTSYQDEGYTDSPIYQNPYWGMTPEQPASK